MTISKEIQIIFTGAFSCKWWAMILKAIPHLRILAENEYFQQKISISSKKTNPPTFLKKEIDSTFLKH